jgi:dTDP-4-dehydrorhamnose reductase
LISAAKDLGFSVACMQVLRISTKAYPTMATRPLNSRLNTKKLEAAFDITLPDWQSSIIKWLNQLEQDGIATTNPDKEFT